MRRDPRQRGQALLEYSVLSWLMIAALVLTASVRIVPDGDEGGVTVVEAFFRALQSYRDSIDFVLNLPVP